ncbi:peptide chain release factor N(5)-glutamine methyltransferase [Mucilaginibacter sp. CSA2-8R]|uniref:peptide chain release factor N(5)-glutamine methyltransferase n=1 Tax=Mucilaginibacter sp. CSA2-8R TaxID=3141542 RepID=UPI00315C93E7
METVKDAYDQFKAQLALLYHSQEADAMASVVLSDLTGYSKAKLKAFTDDTISPEHQLQLHKILEELVTGKPIQYVLGHAHFYGLNFKVTPATLIPRPETEELVQWVLDTLSDVGQPTVLDVGTGSGCIPITVKYQLPNSKVFAIDISSDALTVAQDNAQTNGVDVTFVEADVLNMQAEEIAKQCYQVVISNPPYITETDKLQMHKNVTDFEPHTALFVPDTNPLLFYTAITDFAATHLVKGGFLFFEINESYGSATMDVMKQKGFINAELRQDLMGKDRMIRAEWPGA